MTVKSAICHVLLHFRVSLAPSTPTCAEELSLSNASFIIHSAKELLLRFESLVAHL